VLLNYKFAKLITRLAWAVNLTVKNQNMFMQSNISLILTAFTASQAFSFAVIAAAAIADAVGRALGVI